MSDGARRVLLLGDSILDNRPYTRPEPDTCTHLQRLLGSDWEVQLLAEDGATMAELPAQLGYLVSRGEDAGSAARRADVAVVSIGGNDATAHTGVLEWHAGSSAEVLEALLEIAEEFAARYEEAVRAVLGRAERVVLCTIYEAPLEPAAYARLARVPLAVLNDRILRIAGQLGLEVLELRDVCTEPGDFVMQIEPSARGAAKLAHALAAVVRAGPGSGAVLHAGRALADGS